MSVHQLRRLTPAEEAVIASAETGLVADDQTRLDAIALLRREGLPHRRIEAWHYTDLRALIGRVPANTAGSAAPEVLSPLLPGSTVVDLGASAALPEAPEGVTLRRSNATPDWRRPVNHLDREFDTIRLIGAAFGATATEIEIAPGAEIAAAIELRPEPGATGARGFTLCTLGAGAKATIVERLSAGHAGTLSCGITDLTIGEDAEVLWIVDQAKGDAETYLGQLNVSIGANARFKLFVLNAGGALVRMEVHAETAGEGADIQMRGVNLLGPGQHIDVTTTLNHTVAHTTSTETFRNVVTGGHGVFQGMIKVSRGAQKTDARMACNTLLLSDEGDFSAKPELEIFADDVQCGHGATAGEIDANHLFYLMSRGIPEHELRALLVKAFVDEVVEELEHEDAIAALEARIDAWLEGGALTGADARLRAEKDDAMNAETPIRAGYDVEAIRRDFPILSKQVYGKPLVYLDNGASAQKPKAMLDAIQKAYSQDYANVHRGLHFLSNKATEEYENAREVVRAFLNAGSVDEVVFTSSATEAINLVAYGYGMQEIGEGDEIVLTIMEHHSNIVPWHFLRERKGAKLVFVPVEDDGSISVEAFERAITPRTKLVAMTHMSNVLGTVTPVKAVTALAHAQGIPVVDGSQAAVHLPVDVRDLDCDFYVVTGHKLYGPTGIGVLYGKAAMLERMRPFNGGGEMIVEVTEDNVTYNAPPHRFEAGTPQIAQAIGLAASLRYMESLGRDAILAHEERLRDYAHERLGAVNSLRIYGRAPGKGAIVSFDLAGIHAHDVAMVIDREGVAVRAGTHCAQPLLKRFGATSTCRASFGLYNTTAEIDILAEALDKARRFFA